MLNAQRKRFTIMVRLLKVSCDFSFEIQIRSTYLPASHYSTFYIQFSWPESGVAAELSSSNRNTFYLDAMQIYIHMYIYSHIS